MKDIARQIVEASRGMTPDQRMALEDELLEFMQAQDVSVIEEGVRKILAKHDVELFSSVYAELTRGLSDWARALVKGIQ